MSYSTFYFHINPIIHYLFAFLLIFLIIPKGIFKFNFEELGERIISRYISMVFMLILSGYVLVVTKLFEVISIAILFSMMFGIKYWRFVQKRKKSTISYLMKYLFDTLDGLYFTNVKIIKSWVIVHVGLIKTQLKEKFKLILVIECTLLFIISVIAFYIRFYDVMKQAAPSLADSYVTLSWMKYIASRELFHDGIYPQGFYIILATLFKFSSIDGLFVLRYTGPLNTMLIMFSLYYVIRKLTGNGIGALMAASIYGCFLSIIYWFPLERQVGTNSQEYAFVFIYLNLYFLIKYCLFNRKQYLYIGMMGTAIIGLVHSFAFAFMGILIGLLMISYFIVTRTFSKQLISLVGYALITVVIAILPILIGLLLGKEFHENSMEYLLRNNYNQVSPPLVKVDYITLICLGFISLILLTNKLASKDRLICLFTVLAGYVTFGIYYFGGTITNNVLIASRGSELMGILTPFVIGICCSILLKQLPKKWTIATYLLFSSYLGLFLFLYKPNPIVAYKLEHNAVIEQYFKIRNMYRPKTWLMISNDNGYSISLGTGYHMHINDFVNRYDPSREAITKNGDTKPDVNLPPHIFLAIEKQMFKVSEKNSIYPLLETKYEKRQLDYLNLKVWIKKHQYYHNPVDIFYEDSNVIIYHLKVKVAKTKHDKIIWSD